MWSHSELLSKVCNLVSVWMSSMITDKEVKPCSSAKISIGLTDDMFVLQQQRSITVDSSG